MDDAPTTSPELPPLPAVSAHAPEVVQVVEAIYEDGVIKPLVPLELPAGTPITLQIATRALLTRSPAPRPQNGRAGNRIPLR